MSEDDSRHPADSDEKPAEKPHRSWLDRISAAISGEPTSSEDLIELLRDVQADGVIGSDTLRMMEGAIGIADMTVGDVMVARAQMVALPADGKLLDLMKQVVESGHSRFPVHGEDKDEILGILLAKDLLRGVVCDNAASSIHELLRPAVLIPESKNLNILLREFRQSRNHMAIVIDEYGGVAGLVTIEDVLEQIVGEIDDEHDDASDDGLLIAAQADGQFVVDALTPIADFNERFGADFDDDEYDTIGGLITAAIGHLPEAGEELTLGRFRFRVARADARRLIALHVDVHADA
ncbi:MAG TPA: transporter associated domain-containing protein [Thermomonas sp.]|jgi:magnesium and cobalt transporter|nr:transporter associated domain-containing protein [Thermomonas sp.]HQY48795.1 transporter associated domain-containing protein [Thermomonas sp.]HRA56634.1 transporter associated domain-containing protein [Thermomonas sp.]